jgi:hypothetical protein
MLNLSLDLTLAMHILSVVSEAVAIHLDLTLASKEGSLTMKIMSA